MVFLIFFLYYESHLSGTPCQTIITFNVGAGIVGGAFVGEWEDALVPPDSLASPYKQLFMVLFYYNFFPHLVSFQKLDTQLCIAPTPLQHSFHQPVDGLISFNKTIEEILEEKVGIGTLVAHQALPSPPSNLVQELNVVPW